MGRRGRRRREKCRGGGGYKSEKVEMEGSSFYRLDMPQGRETLREAAMRQEIVTVTRTGISRVMMAAFAQLPLSGHLLFHSRGKHDF